MRAVLSHFGGIVPRLADHMLAPTQATVAHDVKLRNGRIEPWRNALAVYDAVKGAKSMHLYGCCLLSWEDVVTCTELAPDWGRLYLTGRQGCGLEVAEVKDCKLSYYLGGVPHPTTALTVTGTETCGVEVDARSYVYTYVNRWGEESAPSPPSNIIRVADGTVVTISGIAIPPEDHGIIEANIYRATTGFREATGKLQSPLTDYLYVGTVNLPTTMFVDNIQGQYLGAALETQYDRMPPYGLQGITAIGDQVRLAGFRDNKVFLSEPFQPHNWPAEYDLTLDYNIVHMLALDQRLFVTTTSTPYIIDVSNCDATKCTPVTSIDFQLADIACEYPHAAIMTYHGLFYATQYGIVLLQPNGEWHIITAKWFGEDEWRKIKPHTLRMAYWEGFLFFATDVATFLLNINSRPYGDMEGAELVTLSDIPVDMLRTGTGQLLYLQKDTVWEWDAGKSYRPYIWQSRQITQGNDAVGQSNLATDSPARAGMWWPTSVKLGGNASFMLLDSHGHVAYQRFISKEKPRRVPRCGRHQWYQIRLSGTDTIYFVDLGTAHFNVNAGV